MKALQLMTEQTKLVLLLLLLPLLPLLFVFAVSHSRLKLYIYLLDITIFLGDGLKELLLQGHIYVLIGKKNVPQYKLLPGQQTILEPHELMLRLSLKEAQP